MENSENFCLQRTTEYVEELKSFMDGFIKELNSKRRTKRTVFDRLPSNLVEEIILVLNKKSNQPAAVRDALTWINSQVVIRVISKEQENSNNE